MREIRRRKKIPCKVGAKSVIIAVTDALLVSSGVRISTTSRPNSYGNTESINSEKAQRNDCHSLGSCDAHHDGSIQSYPAIKTSSNLEKSQHCYAVGKAACQCSPFPSQESCRKKDCPRSQSTHDRLKTPYPDSKYSREKICR